MLGSLGAASYRARLVLPPDLDAAVLQAAGATLGGAVAAAQSSPALTSSLLPVARQAFTDAMLTAAAVGSLSLLALAILVQRRLRQAGT